MIKWLQRSAPERAPLRGPTHATLARLAQTGTLPTLPQAATAALALAREPVSNLEKLGAVISTDVGLAACVLRLANSAAYARREPAKTVRAAMVSIGMRKTCDIIVAASARRLYGAAGAYAEGLWAHALATAIAAEELARLKKVSEPERAFLPGLLHDVGRVALLVVDPAAFGELMRARQKGRAPAFELKRYGLDHAEASAALVEAWGFSAEHCDAIRWHHEPARATTGLEFARDLQAADALANALDGAPDTTECPAAAGLPADEGAVWVKRVSESFAAQHAVYASAA